MLEVGAHACTDVTGFGLLGHLQEMINASEVGARISMSDIPILPEAWEHLKNGVIPDGTFRNIKFLENKINLHPELDLDCETILCDPQTSGGLLISVSDDRLSALLEALEKRGVSGVCIGYITEGSQLVVDL
jgi:selenide,water dikinase